MSMPNIPNITPTISLERCEVVNLLLSSIAMEEIGLSKILKAEGNKLSYFLNEQEHCLHDYLQLNDSIIQTIRSVIKSQILLQLKLEDVVQLSENSGCNKKKKDHDCHCHKQKCTCPPKKHHCKKCCSSKCSCSSTKKKCNDCYPWQCNCSPNKTKCKHCYPKQCYC